MQLTVRELLNRKRDKTVLTIGPDDSAQTALELMSRCNVGALVVMDHERPVGIVAERDYSRKVALEDRDARSTRVRDIMSSNVISLTPNDSIETCMKTITDNRIRHLPIIVDDVLLGIISIGDVVKTVLDHQEFMIEQLTQYITGSTVDSDLARAPLHRSAKLYIEKSRTNLGPPEPSVANPPRPTATVRTEGGIER